MADSGSSNIGSLSIELTATYQAAMEAIAKVERALADIPRKVEIQVTVADAALAKLNQATRQVKAASQTLREPRRAAGGTVAVERTAGNLIPSQRVPRVTPENPSVVTSAERTHIRALAPVIAETMNNRGLSPRAQALHSASQSAMSRAQDARMLPLLAAQQPARNVRAEPTKTAAGPLHVIVDNWPEGMHVGQQVPMGAARNIIAQPNEGRAGQPVLSSAAKQQARDPFITAMRTGFVREHPNESASAITQRLIRAGIPADVATASQGGGGGAGGFGIAEADQGAMKPGTATRIPFARRQSRYVNRSPEDVQEAARQRLGLLGVAYPQGQSETRQSFERLLRGPDMAHVAQRVQTQLQSQRLSSRAPYTAVVQLFENLFGGRQEPLLRVAQRQALSGQLERLTGAAPAAEMNVTQREEQLRGTLAARRTAIARGATPASLAGNVDLDIRNQVKALRESRDDFTRLNKSIGLTVGQLDDLSKNTVGASDVMRNFAAGAVGGIFGIMTTQAIVGVAQAVIGAVTPTLQPIIDQMTGFSGAANAVTTQLAQQTTAAGGNLQAVIASTAGGAGIGNAGAAFLQQQLGPATMAQAAAQQAVKQQQLFLGAAGAGGAPTGLYGGYGGLFGGPAFASELGGGPGLTETYAGTLSKLSQQAQSPQQQLTAQLQQPFTNPGNIFGGIENFVSGIGTGVNSLTGNQSKVIADEQKKAAVSSQAFGAAITTMNDEFTRGASYLGDANNNLKLVPASTKGIAKSAADAKQQFINVGKAALDTDNATSIANANLVLIDKATGKVVTSATQYQAYWQDLAQGTQMETAQEFAAQLARQRSAQFQAQGILTQSQVSGGVGGLPNGVGLIQGQLGLQLAAQPLLNPRVGVVAPGAPLASAGGFGTSNAFLSTTQQMQNQLSAQGTAGLQGLQQFIAAQPGMSQAAQTFSGLVTDITAGGQQLAGLQTALGNTQTAVAYQDYLNNIRLATRAVSDASGALAELSSHSMAATSNVGALQAQEFLLGQQSQKLSIGMSQRQINFSVAQAGFQAPGLTSEERAARIQEAQAEASYQQKQLNIQKQQVTVGAELFQAQASRALTDASRAESLAKIQYAAQQQAAAISGRINVLEQSIAQETAKAGVIYQQAVGEFGTTVGDTANYIGQFGDAVGTFAQVLEKFTTVLAADLGLSPNPNESSGGAAPVGSRPIPHAAGALFQTGGPVDMTVGEAGSEAVAILRNPKRMTMGGGSPVMLNVTININGTPASPEEIARQVMDQLNRAASRIGVRNFASAVA